MKTPKQTRDVVTLADLAPRQDVKGGSRVRVFGESSGEAPADRRHNVADTKKMKDLPPKPTSNIKGGRLI